MNISKRDSNDIEKSEVQKLTDRSAVQILESDRKLDSDSVGEIIE